MTGALAAALVFVIGLLIWWPARKPASVSAPPAATSGTAAPSPTPAAPEPPPAPAQPSPAGEPTGGSARPPANPVATSAEDVANAFCEALERGDGRGAKTYLAADAELEYELDLVGQGDIQTTGYSLQPDSVVGARERVFKVVLYYHDPETGQDYDEVYELALRDSGGRWKVSRWVLGARD